MRIKSILNKREKSNGNYDAFYAKITNYSWTFDNGVYNISLKLISLGDIIESLNMNYLSVGVEEEVEDEGEEVNEEVKKTIKSEKDKNDLARLFYYAKETYYTQVETPEEKTARSKNYSRVVPMASAK